MVSTLKRYSNDVMSRQELANVIRNLDLYRGERRRMPTEGVLEVMERNTRITVAPVIVGGRDTPAFEVSFTYPDRLVAQKVVNNLVSGFIDTNIKPRIGAVSPGAASGPTLRVIDPASLPTNPIFPLRKMFAVGGFGAGLGLGGIVALVLHLRRKRQAA